MNGNVHTSLATARSSYTEGILRLQNTSASAENGVLVYLALEIGMPLKGQRNEVNIPHPGDGSILMSKCCADIIIGTVRVWTCRHFQVMGCETNV